MHFPRKEQKAPRKAVFFPNLALDNREYIFVYCILRALALLLVP